MSTTVLPSLPLVGGCVTQQVLKTIVSPADTKHTKKLNVIKKVTYRGGKVTSPLSANQKHAEQVDVTSYRNSFFHNLCTDVLEEGYHLAFRELFNLVREAQALTAADENASHKKTTNPPGGERREADLPEGNAGQGGSSQTSRTYRANI